MIRIMKADSSMDIDVSKYELPLKSMRFAGHPYYILNRKRKNYQPYVIFKDDQIAGVFALETGEILQKLGAKDAVYLRGLSIDQKLQGQGVFKAALAAIEDELKNSGAQSIYLMVNVNNDPAYFAFIKSGFKDTGRQMKQGLSTLKILSKKVTGE